MPDVSLMATQVDGGRQRYRHDGCILAGVEHDGEIRMGMGDQRHAGAAPQTLQATRKGARPVAQFALRQDCGQFATTIVVIEACLPSRSKIESLGQRGKFRATQVYPAGRRCRHVL